MTSQQSQGKPIIEVQEDFNWKALTPDERMKKLEQLHMESKILNTIDLAREKKRILDRDEHKMKKYREFLAKDEKDRVDLG